MGLNAINEFWKRLTSQGIDIDVGSTFEASIDGDFWIDYVEPVAPNAPVAAIPYTYELRERRTRRKILYYYEDERTFFCRTTEELTYVAVPEVAPA